MADAALLHVPRREELHEIEPVGASDFHVPFDSHVPEGDVFQEMPILRHRIVVVARQERVVVDRVGLATRLQGRVEEGRTAETCPALDQGHVVDLRFGGALPPGPLFLGGHAIHSGIENQDAKAWAQSKD